MPSRYSQDAGRLKAEILTRMDGGEDLRAVCVSPDMPAEQTVRNWARADTSFGEALVASRQRGTWRRLWAFDEAKAAAFLARARAGEPINALIGQPGMPSRAVYTYWKATQAPFAEAVFGQRQRRDAQLGARGRARHRAFDQALADRIIVRFNNGLRAGVRLQDVLTQDPELPCWETMMRWRRERPEFDQVLRTMISVRRAIMIRPVPEPMVEDVVNHIVQGGSFASLSRLPGAPSWGTLRRWMRDPQFAEAVTKACGWREDFYQDQIQDVLNSAPPGSVREMKRAVGPLRRQLGRLHKWPSAPGPRRATSPSTGLRPGGGSGVI